ncbi:hypothetical protein COU18_00280 [Candidatus Kaiserbacteria bacterium CG10_big_fil_rev_8_21_14_0_10_51_14]|uniref:BIG2 domain-containing protein n=1 Tax=Candidatus Kaiserbacteria bacterium CG10_big_fil_rev_8_21_14_0_10_51_14 TaxID=1974610 RepID=A0A2H0UCP1_9BACT|nr:MAG: hypothetical protein COU18_00280 [Candidatus Kaiserbacteria bacterium CG10_big_fil_rev_8_21_14_0_10_51_14]
MAIRYVSSACVFLAAALFFSFPAYAQVGLPGIENSVLITYSPVYPEPGDAVRLSAQSSILDLSKSNVLWRVNGKVIAQGTGVTSADVTLGALGVATNVEVSVAAQDDIVASAQATIIPTELDLLVDSDSYVPPFYRGRAYISPGTRVILRAIPQFKRPGGSYVSDTNINFTWKKNGEVIGSASGRGRSSAVITAAHLFGTERITVEARSTDGLFAHEASYSLSPLQPTLMLYQDHPLFGLMYHQALGPTNFIPDVEMTFVAVPYFAEAQRPEDFALIYAWRVNGKAIPSSAASPNAITINAENSSGRALLGLELTHATNYFLDAKGSWSITFSDSTTLDLFRNLGQ